ASCADEDDVLPADAAVSDAAIDVAAPADAPADVPAGLDQAPEALLADAADAPAADMAAGDGPSGHGDGGCLAVQPSTKLYEYWCDPEVLSKQLCFREDYIHL